MKVGDIVFVVLVGWPGDQLKTGLIIEKMDLEENATPFGMNCWMVLRDGKVGQYTDAVLRKIK
jgi:hypothetical protein